VGVTVWEAPPAVLFGMLSSGAQAGPAMISTGRSSEISPQMVDDTGRITLPFVGTIEVAGRTPRQVEEIVRRRLEGIANQAQVLVTISANTSANVTVVGEVASSARVPLTARGERLLDVIAAVGGVKQEINRVTIQVTRDATVSAMPFEQLVRDPRHNVRLRPDDVVAAYYQPFSFTALGASGANAEIPFEASGISLAQALGRINGLQDNRANPRGVFIFRWEAPDALAGAVETGLTTPRSEASVPVIYRIDLTDPTTFFAAQRFPLRNRDILYVSNAPGVDLQKFVTLLSQGAFSIIGITNAIAPPQN
jgi:polysaccharide export outer membrane protein